MKKLLKRIFGDGEETSESGREAQAAAPEAAAPAAQPAAAPTPSAPAPESKTQATAPERDVRYLIVGAGPAGVSAAETLAAAHPGASILLLAGEDAPPYSRMAIPYLLTGMIGEQGTYLRKTEGHYDKAHVAVEHGWVDSVDSKSKVARLADGSTIRYSKLLIATGASPIAPPIEGLDLPGVHHCWTLEDARAIAERASEGSSVVLMGAGFIGCIILEALVGRRVNLTVVEALDRMVPRMMNETAGNMLKEWCEAKGISVHTSTKVSRLADAGGRISVEMDNGQSVEAELVVVATGVKSNTGFLDGSGVKIDDGIVVDHHLRSSDPNIYAAGDCAQGPDFSTGDWSVHAIQPTATEHGRIAALNMAGKEARYHGSLNMNVLDTAGLISASFGAWEGVDGGEASEVIDPEHYRYTRLEFDGDHLVGAITLGRTDHIGVVRGLIQTKVDLGDWKAKLMKDPSRVAEAYVARTA